ncbi:hypothetical protein Q2446_19095, partial [Escherichia coli]|nr:hypothetical protein [Escherichia coli]
FPRVVKERPWKYPTVPIKSQSVAKLTGTTEPRCLFRFSINC